MEEKRNDTAVAQAELGEVAPTPGLTGYPSHGSRHIDGPQCVVGARGVSVRDKTRKAQSRGTEVI